MNKHDFRYTPYYCEENIWHLVQVPKFDNFFRKVVFISNERRACPLWGQNASNSPDNPVWWDYHVIMLCYNNLWNVWDLDTILGLPVHAKEYILKTFQGLKALPTEYKPLFRVIDAEQFIKTFSSDRSHMLDSSGGWITSPPPWPSILIGKAVTFEKFVDMNCSWVGEVLNFDEFLENYSD
jgi:hypothetical protein